MDKADVETQAPNADPTSPVTEVDGGPPSSPLIPLLEFHNLVSIKILKKYISLYIK